MRESTEYRTDSGTRLILRDFLGRAQSDLCKFYFHLQSEIVCSNLPSAAAGGISSSHVLTVFLHNELSRCIPEWVALALTMSPPKRILGRNGQPKTC